MRLPAMLLVLAGSAIAGCADLPPPTAIDVAADTAVADIRLTHYDAQLAVGDTLRIGAQPVDGSGRVRNDVPLTWSSADPAVALVEDGLVIVVGTGRTRIVAKVGAVQASTALLGAQWSNTAATGLAITPASLSLAPSETQALTGSLRFSNGSQVRLRTNIEWRTLHPSVATVTGGRVHAVAAGRASVIGQVGEFADTVSVDVASAVPAPTLPKGTYVVPSTISSDCSVDVTAALHAWFRSVPDSSTLVFGASACYNIDGGLMIDDRHGLTFEGNGATFRVFTRSHRDRANWRLRGGSNLTLRNMIARGANPAAGLGNSAYDTNVEGQHAYRIEGTQRVLLDAVQAYDVWGDFVEAEPDWREPYFPGPPTRNVVVRGSRFERNGRMGIGLTHVDGFVLEDSYVGDVRWSTIDLELDDDRAVGKNIRIERNHFGPVMHQVFVAKGRGLSSSIGNITIRGNVMDPAYMTTCLAAISVEPPTWAVFWSGWTIEDNHLRPRRGGWGIDLSGVKDVVVRNNTITDGTHGGCGYTAPMRFRNSHGVAITGNKLLGGWSLTHSLDAASTGFTISDNTQ